jgi:tRNA A37 threonylcarbamoyladenosine modification protein TsaB
MYTLKLIVNEAASSLSLFRGEELIRMKEWKEERDMGKQLLLALKTLLDEAGLKPEEIEGFTVEGNARENFTSRRIAETVAQVYNFAITKK